MKGRGRGGYLPAAIDGGEVDRWRRFGAARWRSCRCWDGPGRRRRCRGGLGPIFLRRALSGGPGQEKGARGERLV